MDTWTLIGRLVILKCDLLKCVIECWQAEIETINDPNFKWSVNWLQVLQQLIEDYQDTDDPSCKRIISQWIQEREQIRLLLDQLDSFKIKLIKH